MATGFDLVPTAVVNTGPVLPPIDHCAPGSPPVMDSVCAPGGSVDGGADSASGADAGADGDADADAEPG